MRKREKGSLWVVYKMTVQGKGDGGNAVCEQSEWEEMERASPGFHTLVKAGITTEAEAEKLARAGTQGDTPAGVRLKAR